MLATQENVKIERMDDYVVIKIEKGQKLHKTANDIVTALASIANGQEKEALLDISSIVNMTKQDEDLIKQIDRMAMNLKIGISLINPKYNVRNYIRNSKLNERVPTFDTIQQYNSARQGKYYDA